MSFFKGREPVNIFNYVDWSQVEKGTQCLFRFKRIGRPEASSFPGDRAYAVLTATSGEATDWKVDELYEISASVFVSNCKMLELREDEMFGVEYLGTKQPKKSSFNPFYNFAFYDLRDTAKEPPPNSKVKHNSPEDLEGIVPVKQYIKPRKVEPLASPPEELQRQLDSRVKEPAPYPTGVGATVTPTPADDDGMIPF